MEKQIKRFHRASKLIKKVENHSYLNWERNGEQITTFLSFLVGMGLGSFCKQNGCEEFYYVLPAINFFTVGFPRNMQDFGYILGVAANYIPEVIQMYYQ